MVFNLSFVHCFPFLYFANYLVYKFNISLFKRKILTVLNSYVKSDNQIGKSGMISLSRLGYFVHDLHASVLITPFL